MERKQAGQRILAFLLLALGAVCVAVPFVTLFTGGGTYSWQFKSPETAKMIGEIALVFALTAGGILLIRRPLFQWGFTALICLLFNWIHVVFLPMAVSALYLGYLLLTGYFLSRVGGAAEMVFSPVRDGPPDLAGSPNGGREETDGTESRNVWTQMSGEHTERGGRKAKDSRFPSHCLSDCDDTHSGRQDEPCPGL